MYRSILEAFQRGADERLNIVDAFRYLANLKPV